VYNALDKMTLLSRIRKKKGAEISSKEDKEILVLLGNLQDEVKNSISMDS